MGQFKKDAEALLAAIGGSENITAVTHCATRMRFVLKDEKRAKKNKDTIEKIPSVKGTFLNAGQFQVIIGNVVPFFYNDFTAISGIEGVSKESAKSSAKKNQNLIQRLIATLAEIFTPLLPAIIVGGLILGFRNILEAVPMWFLQDKTIVESSEFWAAINRFLWLPGEAIFHFLPVGVTWSITRKMGTTQILGIVLGITLVSPQLLNAYGVNGASAEVIEQYTIHFGFFDLFLRGYQAQVIPAMLAGFLLVYLEKFFRKRIPEAISMIFVPFLSLIPTIIAAHLVLGPIGWSVGQVISSVVNAGLTSGVNWLFGGIFGTLYAPLVITGLHHTTLAIDAQLIADFGSTNLWPMICLSNIAQGAAVLGIVLAHKANKEEEQISVPSLISAWLGVTEPAMFGINLKFMFPFVAGMIGSGLAGLTITLLGVRANAIGVGGLPGILAIRGQDWGKFALGMFVAILVPLVLTLFFNKSGILKSKELEEAENETGKPAIKTGTITEIFAPMSAKVLPLSKASDPVFAEGVMGSGVVLDEVDGHLLAPFDGIVATIFPTKHAIGLVSHNGVEVLIHIGLDTVKLNGQHFTTFVKTGQTIKRGEKLIDFDVAAIQEAGYLTQTPILVTNAQDYQVDIEECDKTVEPTDLLMKATKI